MEKATIIALLEKYWQAETTIAEEQLLADYFRGRDDLVDPELASYRDLFLYFGQEGEVTAGPGFDQRILERVGLSARPGLTERPDLSARPDLTDRPAIPIRSGRTFRLGFISAAASICAVVAGLMWLSPHTPDHHPAIASTMHPRQTTASTAIHDTYDDPEQALAAVRHALLIASTHLNEGRRSLTGAKK